MWLYFVLSLLSGITVYWLCVVDRHRHSKHTGYAEYSIQALGQHRQDIIAKIRETKVARHEAALAEDYRTAVQYKHVLEEYENQLDAIHQDMQRRGIDLHTKKRL